MHTPIRGIISRMDFFVHDTVRESARRLLASTTRPLTVAHIAEQINTTPTQARRVLRQLEGQGVAVRERGRGGTRYGGRLPDWWRAAR